MTWLEEALSKESFSLLEETTNLPAAAQPFHWHVLVVIFRKLTWIYTLGTAVLRGNFQSKPIEMQMNTLQAALCMLLNDVDELMYQEVWHPVCLGGALHKG